VVAGHCLVEGKSLRLVAGAGGGGDRVDEEGPRAGSVHGRWQVEGEGSLLGTDLGYFLHDAGGDGHGAEPLRGCLDGSCQAVGGRVLDLLAGLEAERLVVPEPAVDLGEICDAKHPAPQFPILHFESRDLIEADAVDLVGSEGKRRVTAHRPQVDLLTVGKPAEPRSLRGPGGGQHLLGEGIPVASEGGSHHRGDLIAHCVPPLRRL
jgi:hypothetical protein